MSSKSVLDKLFKALEAHVCENESGMPNIGEVSILIEHKKFKLANLFSEIERGKDKYLFLVNMGLVTQHNIYAAALKVLDDGDDVEKTLKQFKKAYESTIDCLRDLFADCKDEDDSEEDEDEESDEEKESEDK